MNAWNRAAATIRAHAAGHLTAGELETALQELRDANEGEVPPEMARARADTMDESRAAEILTWTDEPELLAMPGEPAPTFSRLDIAAARIFNERAMIRFGYKGLRAC